MSTTNAIPGPSHLSSAKSPATYDFTKRKRWADLLFTELVDNLTFVLSTAGKILYTGNAVTELLGWRADQLVDVQFMDLVDNSDQERFRFSFTESFQTSTEFNILVRLRHSGVPNPHETNSPPESVPFEMRCYPHVTVENTVETKCFFAMAVPYPSRITCTLATIIDLKAENERLQHMIAEYRARLPPNAVAAASSQTVSSGNSMYATSSLPTTKHGPHSTSDALNGHHPNSGFLDGPLTGVDFSNVMYGQGPGTSEEQVEEGSKKKKPKRTHNSEEYVCMTCGRTDSPEWRKGPAGPKTLCNACGLRWAKQMRRTDEQSEPPQAGSSGKGAEA